MNTIIYTLVWGILYAVIPYYEISKADHYETDHYVLCIRLCISIQRKIFFTLNICQRGSRLSNFISGLMIGLSEQKFLFIRTLPQLLCNTNSHSKNNRYQKRVFGYN